MNYKDAPFFIRIILSPLRLIQMVIYVLIAVLLVVAQEADMGEQLLDRIMEEGKWF